MSDIQKYAINMLKDLGSRDFKLPSITEFSRTIILPDSGEYFNPDSKPFIKPIFEAFDNPDVTEIWATGCTQSGKTTAMFVLPVIYTICVLNENAGIAVPSKPMGMDKWDRDLLPILKSSQYSHLLSNFSLSLYNTNSVKFNNGRFLKWFLGSAKNDASRAGYTVRSIFFTEASQFGGGISSSEEGNLFSQICSRTHRFGNSRKILAEGTPTLESGIVWHTIKNITTDSRIQYKCPQCKEFSTYDKSTYIIPTDVKKDDYAGFVNNCYYACPLCQYRITEDDRKIMLKNGVIKHNRPDAKKKMGISWGAFDNDFWSLELIAEYAYTAFVDPDQEKAQRYFSQHIMGTPYVPTIEDILDLDSRTDPYSITEKSIDDTFQQYEIPDQCSPHLSVGIDVQSKWGLVYTVCAGDNNANIYTIDYGKVSVDWDNGGELSIQRSVKELLELVSTTTYTYKSKKITPSVYLIDRGYLPDTLRGAITTEMKTKNIILCKGFGNSVQTTNAKLTKSSDPYYSFVDNGYKNIDHDVDREKEYLRNRMLTTGESTGKFLLFRRNTKEHLTFIKQLLSEYQVYDEVKNKWKWTNDYRNNHYLDSTILSILGLRVLQREAKINITFADDPIMNITPEENKKQVYKPVNQTIIKRKSRRIW